MKNVRLVPILILLSTIPLSNSVVEENVKQSLMKFMERVSGNRKYDQEWGWNMSSDPCKGNWVGVACDSRLQNVVRIILDDFNFTGTLDAYSLCRVNSLTVLSLSSNSIAGSMPEEIGNCKNLTHFYMSNNLLSGSIPATLAQLNRLRRLDISDNQLTGRIPEFGSFNLLEFNVSNNKLSGKIPEGIDRFSAESFSGNPKLCGKPLSACPPSAAPAPAPAPAPTPTPPVSEAAEPSRNKFFPFLFAFVVIIASINSNFFAH